MVLLHVFDDNVAVVTTVANVTTKFKLGFGLRTAGRVRGANGGSRRGFGASGGGSRRLSTSVSPRASSNDRLRALRTPQANNEFPNANIFYTVL